MRSCLFVGFKQKPQTNLFLFLVKRIYCYRDDLLSLAEFTLICRTLFRNDKGHIYTVPDEQIAQIFNVFDANHDGFIDRNEFEFCWNHWIKTVMKLVSATVLIFTEIFQFDPILFLSHLNFTHTHTDRTSSERSFDSRCSK